MIKKIFLGSLIIVGLFAANVSYGYNDLSTFPRIISNDIPEIDWVVTGENLDFFFSNRNYTTFLKDLAQGGSFIDIRQVAYLKSKDFLNATVLTNTDTGTIQSLPGATVGMLIDADLDKNTGKDGWDYSVSTSIVNGSQEMKLFEIFSDGVWKYKKTEFSSKHVDPNDKSIELYLRLKEINSPNQFRISFYTNNMIEVKGVQFEISDLSDWLVIPPYKIGLVSDSNFIEMPAGESREVQWTMNSTSDLQGYYKLLANDNPLFTEELVTYGTISTCISNASDYRLNQQRFEQALNIVRSDLDNKANRTAFPNSVVMDTVRSNSIDGLRVNRPSGLVNFGAYDTYYQLLNIKSEPSANQGLNFLTINARPVDFVSIIDPVSQNASSSVFGNETLYGCTPRYSSKSTEESNMDIKVKILPPKMFIDHLSDWFQKNSGLGQLLTATFAGIISSTLTLVVDRKRRRSKK